MPRLPRLAAVLPWLAAALVLRVITAVLSNYPDYVPPNFDSLFLQGRQATFPGMYAAAFYLHIAASPLSLLIGLLLVSDRLRRTSLPWHRRLGRGQVALILFGVAPSGAVMSAYSFAGPAAGASFFLLSFATAGATLLGVRAVRRRNIASHRRWMARTFVLLCSAVVLRLVSGAIETVGAADPYAAYIVAAWVSWLLPLAAFELWHRLR